MTNESGSHEATSQGAASHESSPKKSTRWLVARVLVVQVITLVALYWLQAAFGSG